MQLIHTVETYAYLILGSGTFLMVTAAVIAYYLLKVRKIAATEERVDYSGFRREDSTEYAKFEDIVSSGQGGRGAMGMIVMNGYTFVAGIEVSGYNYYGASIEEREGTMINSIAFFNIVEQPIQMRQTVRAIDLEPNINRTMEDAKEIERRLIDKRVQYEEGAALLDRDLDNDRAFDAVTKRLDGLKKDIRSLEWQLSEAKELVEYMQKVSEVGTNMKKINQVMFSYVYNPDEQVEELTKEEIYIKAEHELMTKALNYGGALENCGCSWHMLSSDDLVNLLRRHNHPVTVDAIKLSELLNGSYSALYVSSDALKELEKERLGEEQFQKEIEALEKERMEQIASAKRKTELERRRLQDSIAGKAFPSGEEPAEDEEIDEIYIDRSRSDSFSELTDPGNMEPARASAS